MIDDVGIFRTNVEVAAMHDTTVKRTLTDVMVDTGSEYNWVPADILQDLGVTPVRVDRFETADGRILERDVGFAVLFTAGRSGPAVVVFANPGDLVLLGAHGLEGMNLRIDLVRRELVPAGPVPAAAFIQDAVRPMNDIGISYQLDTDVIPGRAGRKNRRCVRHRTHGRADLLV